MTGQQCPLQHSLLSPWPLVELHACISGLHFGAAMTPCAAFASPLLPLSWEPDTTLEEVHFVIGKSLHTYREQEMRMGRKRICTIADACEYAGNFLP